MVKIYPSRRLWGARATRPRFCVAACLAVVALTLAGGAVCAKALAEEQPAMVRSTGTVLVTLPWGAGAGQVGLAKADEGLTRGPEALAIAPDGRVAVLDSVNRRVVLLDPVGKYLGKISLKLAQPRFLAVDDECLYVLDPDTARMLSTYSWSGKLIEMVELPTFEDVVTGLFATSAGAFVEVAHRASYALGTPGRGVSVSAASAAGQAARRELAGRPVGGDVGHVASVTFKPQDGARIKRQTVDESGQQTAAPEELQPNLALGRSIDHLLSVDDDGHGGLLVGARLAQPEGKGAGSRSIAITKVGTGQIGSSVDGAPRVQVPEGFVLLLAESSFAYLGQPYVVAPDGRIFQATGTDQGYTILVHVFGEVQP